MVDKAAAAAAKAKGNAALSAKNFEEAITAYTEAISHDPTDKVFYSNRSAAYASMSKWQEALDDGLKCTEVDPAFAKGYGRAGTAYQGQGEYEKAIAVYKQGLEKEPGNALLQQGLESAQQKIDGAANPIAQLFSKPENLQKLASNPQTAGFLSQPDFIQKIQEIAQNPAMMNTHMTDPRIQTALGVMLGMGDMSGSPGGDAGGEPTTAPSAPAPAPAPPPPPRELSEEEKARKEIVDKAEAAKALGAGAFKAAGVAKKAKNVAEATAKVEEALKHFTEAAEIDDTNMAYLNNRAACMVELKQYEECIAECQKAIDVGRKQGASFDLVAKSYARIANCKEKLGDLDGAIGAYDSSLMENHDVRCGFRSCTLCAGMPYPCDSCTAVAPCM